ncbi:MAG: MotA/TolQ/ExbB proton channel family protein [SAR324 cluster bacterium]|nr:MotA/TolQ/ExbB proton channel family protein [SAR324 cluster bacterium]
MSQFSHLFQEKGILTMVLEGSLMGQLVLVALMFMSSLSWAIIVLKWLQFRTVMRENEQFTGVFNARQGLESIYQQTKEFKISPLANLLRSAYWDWLQLRHKLSESQVTTTLLPHLLDHSYSRIERIIEQNIVIQQSWLDRRLSTLATISSASPFVGLFGTVLGIIDSFQDIGVTGVTSLAAVAPGMSEALVATAAGLLAAIPALIAYNHYKQQTRNQANQLRNFSMDLLSRIEWTIYEHVSSTG